MKTSLPLISVLTALAAPLLAQGDHLHGFGPVTSWGAAYTTGTTETHVADVNGDKLDGDGDADIGRVSETPHGSPPVGRPPAASAEPRGRPDARLFTWLLARRTRVESLCFLLCEGFESAVPLLI